jgi:cytoskeletal protein CcmA (bactofilin family)
LISNKSLTVFICLATALLSQLGRVEAAEFRSGLEVRIGADEALDGDVYAAAGRVVVDGTINGDLLAAGGTIEVNGAINGDLIVAARAVSVNGPVEDDVRAAGAELLFRSSIGEDLIVAGNRIEIEPSSVIGQDLVASADSIFLNGGVAGNIDLTATDATIAGTVEGNVQAVVERQLVLSPESRIDGTLHYTSANEVTLQSGAEVSGEVTQQLPVVEMFGIEYAISTITLVMSRIIEQSKWFIGTLLVGLTLIWLCPRTIHDVIETLSRSPYKSLGLGVLLFPLIPLLLLVAMIVALSTVGFSAFPLVAIPGAAYAGLLLLAKPAIAMSIGRYVARHFGRSRDSTPVGALAVGAALLATLGLIPYVDTIVGWLTLIMGFGMWFLFWFRRYREARATETV